MGLAADALVGEPPDTIHPVAAFGSAMEAMERRLWADRRWRGMAFWVLGTGCGLAAGIALAGGGAWIGRRAGYVSSGGRPRAVAGLVGGSRAGTALGTAVALAVCSAGRCLGESALAVSRALDAGDVDLARGRLRALVGRDLEGMGPAALSAAAVESVAENTVDAVVAPGFWAAIAGAPGATCYRAVNTLDSMVGHRSARYARFGWASARADDLANLVPARLTALLVAAVRPRSARSVWRALRSESRGHPSPNAGVAESAFAAALGVQLGGPCSYGGRLVERPVLCEGGRVPGPSDIEAAVRLSREVTVGLGMSLLAARSVLG